MARKLGPAGEAPARPHPARTLRRLQRRSARNLRCDRWRRDVLRYATPQELLDLEKHDPAELMRRFKQTLDHVCQTGRLSPSDLQLPLQLSPFDTSILPLTGYEGGEFDPERLGAACIIVPPAEGRGSNTKGTWSVNPDGGPSNMKATSEPGLFELRMSVRKRAGKSAPKLRGKYFKFMLQNPLVDFLVPDPEPSANSSNGREPFVLMHMPRPRTRTVAPEPAAAQTHADFTAASEITPEDPLEDVTALVQPFPGKPDQVTGLDFSLLGVLSLLVAVSRPPHPS